MADPVLLGVDSFVARVTDPSTGREIGPEERFEHLLEEIALADRVGLHSYGIGEHHRSEYYDAAPPVILAAAAARTERIRLRSAVTVLSAADPVRVFQEFATIDLISRGRVDLVVGRGSFVEAFPLFGLAFEDYDELFTEKLELLLRLREDRPVTWSGEHRAPMRNQVVTPRPIQQPLPVWIAVGGTAASAERTGRLGLPMALAIIGGAPERFAPFVEIFREGARRAGHDPARLALSINGHGHVAESSQRAADEYWPGHEASMRKIGRERGWPPPTRDQYDLLCGPRGALLVGDPKTVAEKILFQYEIFRNTRYLIYLMGMPHRTVMRSIELLGTQVAPLVRAGIAEREVTMSGVDATN